MELNKYKGPRRLFWIGVAMMTFGFWKILGPGWAALFAGFVIAGMGIAGVIERSDLEQEEKKPLSKEPDQR